MYALRYVVNYAVMYDLRYAVRYAVMYDLRYDVWCHVCCKAWFVTVSCQFALKQLIIINLYLISDKFSVLLIAQPATIFPGD